jgi:signal transduction histidine kinase
VTTVYVVDDDPLVTESLGAALRIETPFDVEVFTSARDALAAVAARPPDLVITDFKMPGMDGLALLREVRRLCPDAVLILLTGYADKESAIDAINEVGIYQYVEKPWDLQDLLLKMKAGLERKELVQRLVAANAELARQNAELRLAHERLVGAERLAAVGRVVSGIAHEIGNQLALVGYAEAIKTRTQSTEIAEFAEVIVAAQKRLAAMVGEIKDYARRPGDSVRELSREPSDVTGVIDEALAILRYDAEVAGCKIVREIDGRPLARVNRGKLSQVVINLVRNAAQASDRGGEVKLGLSEDRAAGVVRLTIEDRGAGMSPETLARLGEPFFSTRGDKGSGLGIGISRRIVEEHGGTLTFESRPGEGTRVTVALPSLERAVA